MAYVVYEKNSSKRIDGLNGGPRDRESYATEGAARAARTRFLKAQLVYGEDDILIAESSKFYTEIEKEVDTRNLMSGKDIKIKANTPWCCNPASETYWSM
jgi:hypothetical protein